MARQSVGNPFAAQPNRTLRHLLRVVDWVYRRPDARAAVIEAEVREGCTVDERGQAVLRTPSATREALPPSDANGAPDSDAEGALGSPEDGSPPTPARMAPPARSGRLGAVQGGTARTGNGAAVAASLLAALAVAGFLSWLTYGREPAGAAPAWVAALPATAAAANAASAVALVCGWIAIRAGRVGRHRSCMLAAVGFSALFFVAYVVRHHFHGDTRFPGGGIARGLYLGLLGTHVLGSVVVLALLPLSLRFAVIRRFDSHRALNRWLLPVWLYVSVTGVAVYAILRATSGHA